MTWLFYALIAAVLYSAAAILAKLGIKKADPGIGAGLCSLVMFICAFIMSGAKIGKINIFKFGSTTIIYILISGVLTGVTLFCLYKAIKSSDVVSTVSFAELKALLFLWVGVLWWKNKIGVNLVIATVLCLVGLIIIVTLNSRRWSESGLAFLGGVLLTASMVADEMGLSKIDADDLRLYKLLIATIIIWIISLAKGSGKTLRKISFLDGIYSCISGLAVVGSLIFVNRANALGDNTRVLQVFTVNLIFTIILASIILKEKISGKRIISVIIFVAGLEILLLNKPLF